ncbi:aftiphilin [Haematobia irritans]|uniref:aftiphilin n=1 Tax=Haematobia irritans TaxID=7368 RepID=UPI003F500F8B
MVNVPPLLCSTPPPIDDILDEDDDIDVLPPTMRGIGDEEFCDFSVEDVENNDPLPSPSPDLAPISISNEGTRSENFKPEEPTIVETFNYSINHRAKDAATDTIDVCPQNLTEESSGEERSCRNNAREIVCCEKKEELFISTHHTIPPLENVVSIEDLEDDLSEDELYSPKTSKNLTENDAIKDNDYFKIHHIEKQQENQKSSITVCADSENDNSNTWANSEGDVKTIQEDNNIASLSTNDEEFGDFADFQDFDSNLQLSKTREEEPVVPVDTRTKPDFENNSEDDFDDFVQHSQAYRLENKYETPVLNNSTSNEEVCSIKDDFTGSTTEEQAERNEKYHQTSPILGSENSQESDEFDDFADFQECSTATIEVKIESVNDIPKTSNLQEVDKTDVSAEQSDDDDDDFGDFNTAEPIASAPNITPSPTKGVSKISDPDALQLPKNLNERISNILHIMFASIEGTPPTSYQFDNTLKTRKIQDIPFTSIDAAKALEYQWLNSETRHSFIKSLGIDSRNILYGDNWNPSLPRFAANLSFNPLKPMKPTTSNSGSDSFTPSLEPIPVNTSDCSNTSINHLTSDKKENVELEWKLEKAEASEKTKKMSEISTACKEPIVDSTPSIDSDPNASITMFGCSLESEDNKLSETPPICEMQSVNTLSLPSISALDVGSNFKTLTLNETDVKASNDSLEIVVASTTFSGSFKETHIYTPPKNIDNSVSTPSTSSTSPTKSANIDFDYEKAAMGVIIDETVVKKEYRDIEYNSPFAVDTTIKTSQKAEAETFNAVSGTQPTNNFNNDIDDDFNDEFSDFQSVPTTSISSDPLPKSPIDTAESAKVNNISTYGMILSPAILIPQAISMESNRPKIEWGETASINPEELARIEELFPEPSKTAKASVSNSSQKSTPTHQTAPTISAAVANKELDSDDDDWSEFVSVPVTTPVNNNMTLKSESNSPFKQRSPINSSRMSNHSTANDDEWSDFVSSAPPEANQQVSVPAQRVPQFNSGAWQNANFYNNPLSLYHKGPLNIHPSTASQQQTSKNCLNNNNNNYNLYNQFQMPSNHQQIHVMQNFSTAPVPTPSERLAVSSKNQFQVGSAKVAPSIALIPDLGFVAPAIPTHTSFINSLPKPSINTKK